MNSNLNSSITSFIALLLSRSRSLLAMITLAAWLIISISFYWSQPDHNEAVNLDDINSPIAKLWREYGWQYESQKLYSVNFANDQMGWVIGYSGTILATQDGGKNWSKQKSNAAEPLYSVHFVNERMGWAVGIEGTILATQDGGKNWSKQKSNTSEWLNSAHFVNDRMGWVVGLEGTILATQDSGKNWIKQNSNTSVGLYSVHFVNDRIGWVAGVEGTILVTQDSGKSWSKQNNDTSKPLRSVHFFNEQMGWAVGDEGTILATQDGGKNWSKQNSNTSEWLISAHFVNELIGWVVGVEGTILATQDSGKNWIKQNSNASVGLYSVHFVNDQIGWAVGNNGTILATQNGGKNWTTTGHFSETRLPDWYRTFSILCAAFFLFGLLGIRAPTRSDAISAMLSSDRPRRGNESDALESRKLAWALSRFLRHQRTEPPLTLAINAPWGGGKSSLMNWLREDLQRFGFHPVWFNAWHYEKQEQMFPALLETIRQQAVPSSWLSWSNFKFRRQLLWHRIRIHPWLTGLLFVLICFPAGYFYANYDHTTWASIKTRAVMSLEQVFPKRATTPINLTDTIDDSTIVSSLPPIPRNEPVKDNTFNTLALLLSLFPGLAPLIGLWKGLQSFQTAGNWLSRWFNPTEQSKATLETAYRAQFARDFRAVTSALDHTLIIFIDDLDRCQPESVCEVMETVNFLASEGSCYIVLGIWREGVERAIGLGFAEAAKEFSQISTLQIENENPTEIHAKKNSANPEDDAEIRRRYGQLYLEKLINIWVSVPSLEIIAAQNMLKREQNPSQQPSKPAITISQIKSLLHSRVIHWRDRFWNWCKESFATIGKIRKLESWRNLRWAHQVSQLWRFLIRLIGIYILGAFFLFLIFSLFDEFKSFETIMIFNTAYDNFFASMKEIADEWIRIPLLFFVLLLHGFALKWIYQGLQFAVLRRLPAKPFSQIWLANLLTITAIAVVGNYAFQAGKNWLDSSTVQQQNTFSDRSAIPAPRALDPSPKIPAPVHEDRRMYTAKIIAQTELDWLILTMFGISALFWIEWLRFRLELPDDSPAFEEALLFWSPVLAKRFDTPRRLKRFINHLRFNAMRLRTLEKADATSWEQFWNRYIRGEKLDPVREDEMQGKESGLLLLSVLEACCGADFKIKSMLVNTAHTVNRNKADKAYQPSWEETLTIDAQLAAENGMAWANELRTLLIERLKYFEANAMPQPTLADLYEFEKLAPARITPASVRTARSSAQAAIWDQKIERRTVTRRAAIPDTAQFTSDRRSGLERRRARQTTI